MVRFSQILKYALGIVSLLVALAALTLFWLFDRAMPNYAGHKSLPGLSATTHVYRDEHGVPHIFAANMNDAARALGYIHASERLFQMEMQRRAGQGRLSEAIGPKMLGVDKFIRTLGLYDLAESSAASLSPEAQSFFQAYAEGVNTWLDKHQNKLPVEFLLLGIKPEPWKPADSVVWGKLMGLELSHNYKLEILRAQLAQKMPAKELRWLFPLPPENAPVTTQPRLTEKTENTRDPLDQLGAFLSIGHAASNEWVISGSRTESGKPILANDPHLGLEAPVLWYLARIVTPDLSVKGATVPGLPIVLLGQNDTIAWGFTTTNSDVQDLFVETIDPENADHYLTPKGSKPFVTRDEIIHVKGEADVTLHVRATRHGPVMSDIDDDMAALAGKGKVMALAFTGLSDHDTTSEALMWLNRAGDWREFKNALKLYQAPPQNVVYADIKGDIGFFNPGFVPVRKSGTGLTLSDGASGAYDWRGMVAFDKLPQVYNPEAGFVFNANNALVGKDSRTYLGKDWEEPYRAERLQQYFDTTTTHTLDTSAAMQADHVSLAAKQLLPVLLQTLSSHPRAAEARALLKDWDGTMDKDRPEPLMFEAWLYEMHQILLVDKTGNDLKEKGPYSAATLFSLLTHHAKDWCGSSHCAAESTKAFNNALDMLIARDGADMKNWRWGNEHIAMLSHKVFSQVPVLKDLTNLSVGSSGDFYTLDRGGSFEFDPEHPFARTHGGGFRGIYDLGDPALSRFMITTGESGHIFSPHYGDFVPLWNDVKSFTISGSREELEARSLPVLILAP